MQRLRSLRHRFWYGVSERIAHSAGSAFFETPARALPDMPADQARRIGELQGRYQVRFEQRMNAATSRNNYEYLDILDRAWTARSLPKPSFDVVCDVGCASFWYAAALQAFFRPSELVGVEVEGHRLFSDGRTRIDYAQGYVSDVPGARFVVADYLNCELPADVVTAWFPFVTPAAILAWRLPLSLLTPESLMARIYHNLRPGGLLVMINHGIGEWSIAERLCSAAGLMPVARFDEAGVLSAHRSSPAILSCWAREKYSY